MGLNKEEIIKALEWCSSGGACSKCAEDEANPYLSREGCMSVQMQNALALIKQLTEENERLKKAKTEVAREIIKGIDDALHDMAMEYEKTGHKTYFAVCEMVHHKVIRPFEKKYIGENNG